MKKVIELETACRDAVEYLKEKCNPHQSIVIDCTGVRLISDDIGLPIKNFQPTESNRSAESLRHTRL